MGIVRRFVNNPVAANMIMLLILLGGLAGTLLIPRELFPEFGLDMITVTVPYPQASPQDIERGVCLKIEDYLANIEGIKEVTSTSREGTGVVLLELRAGADVRKVLDEVKSEVDKISFPDNAEDPIVREVTLRRQVINVAVAGDAPERTLKEIAEDVRDEINALEAVSQVTVSGVRDYEIAVELDDATLREYGLTLDDVAKAIRNSSFDLPAGRIKTQGGELALRIVGQRYTAEEFGRIEVLSRGGTVLYLRDIADVRETFRDQDIGGQFNGQPAALVSVFKTAEEDTLEIAKAVRQYVAAKAPTLPEGIHLETWSDLSRVVQGRLDILVRNGLQGLVLVFAVLWLFLGLRLSFWVALGIPVSLAGAIAVMALTGQSLNMISMFALIMALGLIVDDAIVVGENIYSHTERGVLPHAAAVEGTHQVMMPVIGAVATTWIAFIPLMFMSGTMGRFIRILPAAVILALGFSLLECLIILPPHLAHSLAAKRRKAQRRERPEGRLAMIRRRIDEGLRGFIHGPFSRLSRLTTRNRYVTVTVFLCLIIVVAGALGGGWIKVVTFPKTASDTLQAGVILPTGTPIERTAEVTRRLTAAAEALNEQVRTPTGEPIVQRVYALLGQQSRPGGQSGGHIGEVSVELLPSERRGTEYTAAQLAAMWRENVGQVPDALSLTFSGSRHGPGGKALEFRVLAKTTDQAREIAERLKSRLVDYAGVSDIEHDALPGKMELRITLRRAAYALGLNARMMADQLRDAFYGNESIEIQRGRDEIEVMVRYPQDRRRNLGDIESMRIRTPAGGEVPFTEVADVAFQRGYTTLRRVSGRSVVTVSADVDEDAANAESILADIAAEGLFDELTAGVDGAAIDTQGQREQRAESFATLKITFPLALLGIYTILATIFRSYVQPVIIMVAIPVGLVGAVIGHALLGFPVTMLSMFGMVALTGIVVNDSLVLIDRVNQKVRSGVDVVEAVRAGARERFRAIVLTTVTTVAGMTPLLFERSFQAQFLKPMVVSICFGLIFATTLTLLAVPSLYLIGNDIRRAIRWLITGQWPSREEVALRDEEAA